MCLSPYRLVMSLGDDERLMDNSEILVQYKWGFDGASGQKEYRQSFTSETASDKSVLMTSLVPLQIRCGALVLWQNGQSSSTKYCRPIGFEYTKESKESAITHFNFVQDQIDKLKVTSFVVNDKSLRARHELELTMVDAKIVGYLTDTSTSNCNICDAKPSQMNNFQTLAKLEINEKNFSFGLSTLHCWIRCLECVLHIAYRIPIQRTDARGIANKEIVNERKRVIQAEFRTKTGSYNFKYFMLLNIS